VSRRFFCLMCLILTLLPVSVLAERYATLRYRDEGPAVLQMQEALNQLGYNTRGADGKFGPGTEEAVRAFQRDQKLNADGLAGHATLTRLYELAGKTGSQPAATPKPQAAESSSGSSDYATLRYKDTGERVKKLQQTLKDQGYYNGTVDGSFRSGTYNAVKAFQKANKLYVDGVAGAKTLKLLWNPQPTAAPTAQPVKATPAPTLQPTAAPTAKPAPKPAAEDYSTLRYKDTGERVKKLQQALKDQGYYNGTVDGSFRSGTYNAVKAFQKANKLYVDGVAGAKTLKLLWNPQPTAAPTAKPAATPLPQSTQAPAAQTPQRTLRYGAQGADVTALQHRLAQLGYNPGAVSGVYGKDTQMAVKAFQTANGLTDDGVAGAMTLSHLFSDQAVKAGSGSVAATYKSLGLKAEGQAVTNLQSALKALGYNTPVSGVYDKATRSAVIQFQMRNSLVADGVAGQKTQSALYGKNPKNASAPLPQAEEGAGKISGPAKSSVKLLHWLDEIKPTLQNEQVMLIFDPASSLSWELSVYARGRHCDSEPLTLRDTQIMNRAFGQTTWSPKIVYVKLPDGRWSMATMHNTPHLKGRIEGNGFDGHLCVHFLRDMDECKLNDPSYGVQNQNVLRQGWKKLTGQTVE